MNKCVARMAGKAKILISGFFQVMMLASIFTMAGHATSFASTVALSWDPNTESTLAGYKVYYKADSSTMPFNGVGAAEGASPINVHNQTTATVSGLDPNKTYYFAITAYDTSGAESPYSNIVTILESVLPVTVVTAPANNSTVSGTVSVTASASDNVGVTKVEFYVNGVLQASDTSTPYMFSWNTSALASGTYTLMTKAYDAAGNIGQSGNVVVSVVNDTTAPTVSLVSPVNGSTVSGTLTVMANASDNVGVSRVEIYSNGTLLFAGNQAPYAGSWNTASLANGSYTLIAKAYDNVGNVGQSANVLVTVSNSTPDTTAPSVSITSPANNATISGTVSVAAGASDNVSVSKVEFYLNGSLQATSTASPFTFNLNTLSFANGSYVLAAKAYDAAGNIGTSTSVAVSVNNPVPDTTKPTVTAFTMPSTAASLSVDITSLTATDAVGVTGYLVTETSTIPSAGTAGWTAAAPAKFTFSAAGSKTAYAWAKDAAGNVSASRSASVTITVKVTGRRK